MIFANMGLVSACQKHTLTHAQSLFLSLLHKEQLLQVTSERKLGRDIREFFVLSQMLSAQKHS